MNDYYAESACPATRARREIKRAYRKAARKLHLDRQSPPGGRGTGSEGLPRPTTCSRTPTSAGSTTWRPTPADAAAGFSLGFSFFRQRPFDAFFGWCGPPACAVRGRA